MATSTLLVALAALCSAPSSAASPDEARDIAAFKRAFGAGRPTAASLEEKRQTLAAMAAHDSAKVVRALVVGYTILEREAAALEEKRRPLLEQLGGKKLLPFRLELKPIRALQGTIIERLLAARDPDAVRSQVKLLLKRRSGLPFSVRAVFAATATRLSDQDRRLVLDAKGKRRPVQDIALLLDAIGSLEKRGADAGPWVVRMLAHKDPLVRERAAHALSRLRWPGSLQPLVARLAVEDGRMRARLGRTLEQLTGMKLGTSGAAWKRWLDQEGGPFMNGEKPLGGHESTVTAEAAGGYYFGIPQDGRSILYVYDNSQSMKQKLHQETDKDGNPVTRQARARKELLAALDQLKPHQRFNIVAFANRLDRLDRRMQTATTANVARAKQWVQELKLRFGTNTYDALELAFNTAGRGAFDQFYALEADTVFLLSDGLPMIQKIKGGGVNPDAIEEILAGVRRWNPFGRIVVHTIGLGLKRKRPRRFMRNLAEQNGGRFVEPK